MKRHFHYSSVIILLSLFIICGGITGKTFAFPGIGASAAVIQKPDAGTAGFKNATGGFEKSANKTVSIGGCSIEIPDYYGDNQSKKDSFLLFGTDDNSALLYIDITSYEHSKEQFEKEKDNFILLMLTGLTTKSITFDLDKSDIKNRHFAGSIMQDQKEIDVEVEFDAKYLGNKFCILYLIQSSNSERDYFSDFKKISSSVKMNDEEESNSYNSEKSSDGIIDPDFKKTMDDYEAFFDEYVEFMKEYKENPSNMELLTKMTEMLQKETSMLSDLEKIKNENLNEAELAYYMEVYGRIMQKLSTVY